MKQTEFPRIARLIDDAIEAAGGDHSSDQLALADLSYDSRAGVLVDRMLGEIRFEGQFVLRDLMQLFIESPGQVFDKERIVRCVWKEVYRPEIHDNKIYVTIKRLRKLLEFNGREDEYILRAKNGYFLNPKIHVLIDDVLIRPRQQPLSKKALQAKKGIT